MRVLREFESHRFRQELTVHGIWVIFPQNYPTAFMKKLVFMSAKTPGISPNALSLALVSGVVSWAVSPCRIGLAPITRLFSLAAPVAEAGVFVCFCFLTLAQQVDRAVLLPRAVAALVDVSCRVHA